MKLLRFIWDWLDYRVIGSNRAPLRPPRWEDS